MSADKKVTARGSLLLSPPPPAPPPAIQWELDPDKLNLPPGIGHYMSYTDTHGDRAELAGAYLQGFWQGRDRRWLLRGSGERRAAIVTHCPEYRGEQGGPLLVTSKRVDCFILQPPGTRAGPIRGQHSGHVISLDQSGGPRGHGLDTGEHLQGFQQVSGCHCEAQRI